MPKMSKIPVEELTKLLTRAEEYSNTDFLSWIKKSSMQAKFENIVLYIFACIIAIQFPCQILPWDILQVKLL